MIVVPSLQPPVFIQTLAVEKHEAEDSPVIRLIHLLRDVPEIEGKDLIASQLILFFFGHIDNEMTQSFIFLKVLADLLLDLCQLVIFVLIFHIFILFPLIIFIIVTFILLGFCGLVRSLLLGRRGAQSRGRGRNGSPEIRVVTEYLLSAKDISTTTHHICI